MTPEEKAAHDEAVERANAANKQRNDDRLKLIEQIADTTDHHDDAEDQERRAAEEERQASEIMAKGLQEEGATEKNDESDTRVTNGETFYRQIVNGVEKWQTLKEIRETASKIEAADDYLKTAAEAVRNASRLALSKDEPSNVEKVDVRSILRAAVLGDEEAIEKLASVLERPSEVTPDVVRQIDQRLSFRTELAQLEAKSKDLLENPYMGRLFRDRLQELKAENPTMGLSEAYTSIDKELRTAFPQVAKTKTTDKLERKKTLVNPPTVAARQQVEEEAEGEEDVVSVIEKMAKARGLTPFVHSPRRT